MSNCDKIKAYFRREERYEGLQLAFKEFPEMQPTVLEAIEATKTETGLSPDVFENISVKGTNPNAYYIEFNDDYDKDGGRFFEIVMRKLGINRCSD